jgi:4a-hydroxytetrahydrobiopterin dehydratase
MTLLTDAEIDQRLGDLHEWRREDGAIVSDRDRGDFAGALAYVNRVGELAERANHHPDILLHGWKNVRLTLSTHSEGGVTGADLDLAAQIAALS